MSSFILCFQLEFLFLTCACEPVFFTSYLFLLLSWLLTSLDCSHVYYGKRLPMGVLLHTVGLSLYLKKVLFKEDCR